MVKKSTKKKLKGLGKSFLKYAERANKNLDLPRVDSPTKKKVVKPKTPKKPRATRPRSVKKPKAVKSPGGQSGQVIVNVNVGSPGGNAVQSSGSSNVHRRKSKKRKKKKKRVVKKKSSSSSGGFDDVLYGYNY